MTDLNPQNIPLVIPSELISNTRPDGTFETVIMRQDTWTDAVPLTFL